MESEDDETLEYIAVILIKIHSAFYELYDSTKVNRFPVCLSKLSRFFRSTEMEELHFNEISLNNDQTLLHSSFKLVMWVAYSF